MKKITYILASIAFLLGYNSCTDQSTFNNPSSYEIERGAFVKFTEGSTIPGVLFEPQNISVSADVFDSTENVSEYVLMLQANISGVKYSTENYQTITSFPGTVNITSQSLADALGIQVDDISFGDTFNFSAKVTREDGTVFYGIAPEYDPATKTISGGNTEPTLFASSYFDAMEFVLALACPPSEPGIYRIDMHDDFGDGWQTNDGNAGDGIQITVDGELFAEIGMCSPYNNSQEAFCVAGDSFDATDTVEIPAGAESIIWTFPGDQYGEISFEIYDPSGTLIGEYGPGTSSGLLVLCDNDLGS